MSSWYYKVKLLTRPFAFCQEAHSSCLTSGMKLSICGAWNKKNILRTVCMLPVAKAVPQPHSSIPSLESSRVSADLRKAKNVYFFNVGEHAIYIICSDMCGCQDLLGWGNDWPLFIIIKIREREQLESQQSLDTRCLSKPEYWRNKLPKRTWNFSQ